MLYIVRNNQDYGPYDEQTLLSYVNNGSILLCDKAKDAVTHEENNVAYFLKKANLKPKVPHAGNLVSQLKMIGGELIFPRKSFTRKNILSDQRLLVLAGVGLLPTLLMLIPLGNFLTFYAIALYFSVIWALFFYYFFKTNQVNLKTTIKVFFITQVCVFFAWDVLGIVRLNPFYALLDSGFPLNLLGYTLGVGLTEEFAKLLPLLIITYRSKEPILPQTLVYYGLMSGIAFGVFEGVQYQMGVNSELEYSQSFFMNIARLTALPFLHAIWCGIAGYITSFAKLYPKYRVSLYFLALAVPALLHGLYDTLCGGILLPLAVALNFVAVILLMTYLKQGVNYQSKLRN